ncbi:hypothetical protein ACQ4WX_29115 [Streptomyces lasalocidi]
MPWTVKNMARRRATAALAPSVLLVAYAFFARAVWPPEAAKRYRFDHGFHKI